MPKGRLRGSSKPPEMSWTTMRRIGALTTRIEWLRKVQNKEQMAWLDLAELGIPIVTDAVEQAVRAEAAAQRKIGAVEHFIKQAEENREYIFRQPEQLAD